MKNILKSIIAVIVNVILCLTAMAQEKFTEGKQTVGAQHKINTGENRTTNNTFVVKKSMMFVNKSGTSLWIHNKKMDNVLSTQAKKNQTPIEPRGLQYSKKGALHLVFKDVLGEKRIKELSPEVISVMMYYNSVGNVIAVRLRVREDTKLTLEEIERLSDAIEKGISFSFASAGYSKNQKFAAYNHTMHTKTILDQISFFSKRTY